jgi:hypothetical protein
MICAPKPSRVPGSVVVVSCSTHHEPVGPIAGVHVRADDVSARVDAKCPCCSRPRVVHCSESEIRPQKSMKASCITVHTHDIAARIHIPSSRKAASWHVKRNKARTRHLTNAQTAGISTHGPPTRDRFSLQRNAGDIKKRRQTRTLTAGPTRTLSVNGRSNLVGAYVGGSGRTRICCGGR